MSVQYFRSQRVVTPEGVRPATIEVRDGVIAGVHAHDHVPEGATLRDGVDGVILPGLVDSTSTSTNRGAPSGRVSRPPRARPPRAA